MCIYRSLWDESTIMDLEYVYLDSSISVSLG
jgi:hypothetical protein